MFFFALHQLLALSSLHARQEPDPWAPKASDSRGVVCRVGGDERRSLYPVPGRFWGSSCGEPTACTLYVAGGRSSLSLGMQIQRRRPPNLINVCARK